MEFLKNKYSNGMSDSILAAYVAGETSEDENIRVKKWMQGSDENKKYIDGLLMIMEQSRFPLTTAPGEHTAWETLSEKIRQHGRKKASIPIRYKWMSAAAIVILLTGSVFIFRAREGQVKNILVTSREIVGDGLRTDTLADGSIVRLDKNSILRCPHSFDSKERVVKLTGGGYFSIVHRALQSFIITVNDLQVTDIGTSFIIQSDSAHTYVSVQTGVVKITRSNKSLLLSQGEKLLVYRRDTSLQKWTVNADTSLKQQMAVSSSLKKSTASASSSLAEDPEKQKKAMRSIIRDIISMRLAESRDSIRWFGLTSNEFIINGQKQPASVRQKFTKKYHVKPDNGFFYGPVQMTGNGFFITKKELEEQQ